MAVIYNNLAVAYYYLKDKESAIKNLNKAKELGYPVNPEFERMVNESL
jgi:Flp pilus assembly protein TadD